MTKDKIKKALELCFQNEDCEKCPYIDHYCCTIALQKDALDLITKQEKEIDFQVQDRARLQREIDELEQAHEQRVELNKVKEKLDSAPNGWAYTGYIDDLIEEIEK